MPPCAATEDTAMYIPLHLCDSGERIAAGVDIAGSEDSHVVAVERVFSVER